MLQTSLNALHQIFLAVHYVTHAYSHKYAPLIEICLRHTDKIQ